MYISPKIAILKLVIDFIKVDNKIHKEEVSWIETLTAHYQYSNNELQQAHCITLCEAISTLKALDTATRNEILEQFKEIVSIDNNIDINERILLAAIQLSLQEDSLNQVQIITVDARHFDSYDHQLIYLEQKECPDVSENLHREHNIIKLLLNEYNIDFFFYPHIAQLYSQSNSYINPATKLLFPNFSHFDNDKNNFIDQYSTVDYCSYIYSLMGKNVSLPPFDAFFMLKIQCNHSAEHHKVDFLCMQCDRRPSDMIELFINSMAIKQHETIPYKGCYRTLFEMFSEKSKCDYDILLEGDLYYLFDGLQKTILEIRGAERKTLFALFLIHKNGVSNRVFASLSAQTSLGKEAIAIYRYFAKEKNYETMCRAIKLGEEPTIINNLRDISKRNSHIGYIKRAFTSVSSLRNPHLYYPQNIKGAQTYSIALQSHKIKGQHHSSHSTETLNIDFFL